MTKYEYLAKLEHLLADMPAQECRDALDYYAEYFDAAGPDHEAETAEKLGDPETVARKIREGAGMSAEEKTESTADANAAAPTPPAEDPAAGPVTRTGLHGPGLLVLFVVILLLVVLALALSAAATGFRGFGRDREVSRTETSWPPTDIDIQAQEPAQTQTPQSAATDNGTASVQATSDWETAYDMTISKVDLELSDVDLTILVDDSVSTVTLRGSGVANDAVWVDQQELTRDAKLEARLATGAADGAALTLVLPGDGVLQDLELKLTGGSAVVPDLTLNELEIDSLGATVQVGSITARQVGLKEEADGGIEAAAVAADEISLDATRGSVAVAGVTVSRQLEVEAVNGSVTAALQGAAADFRLEAENKGGSMTVNGETITGKVERAGNTSASIEAECQSGTVTLGFAG